MKRNLLHPIILISVFLLCCSTVQGTAGNSLRIEGPDGWTKHLEVAQGSTAFLVVLATKEGDGTLYDQYPDGSTHNYIYYFQGYDRLPFCANTPGRHVLSYVIDGKESNPSGNRCKRHLCTKRLPFTFGSASNLCYAPNEHSRTIYPLHTPRCAYFSLQGDIERSSDASVQSRRCSYYELPEWDYHS